jgi:hypothetical protein
MTTPTTDTAPTTVRTISAVQAGCLLAAPAVAFAARILTPPWFQDEQNQPDNARYLAEIAEAPGRNDLGASLTLLSAILFAGVAIVLAGIVRRRMPRLGLVAGVLAGVGSFGLAAVSAQAMVGGQFARAADRDRMIALMDQLMTASPFAIYFLALVLGAVGALLLAVGLYRSALVPRAAAVLTGLGIAAVMLTTTGPAVVFVAGSAVIAAAGLSWVALAARRR